MKTHNNLTTLKNLKKSSGLLFVVSAPSGAGKSTLCNAVREYFDDICYSISYTTRVPRKGETNGKEYYFISKEDFIKGIQESRWAEWAQVHGNYYGTSAEFLDHTLSKGNDILLDIDVQGAEKLLNRYPDSITIFIMPTSLDVLEKRLKFRGTDKPEDIITRLSNAQKEIAYKDRYRHIIVNDQLPAACSEIISIIKSYR